MTRVTNEKQLKLAGKVSIVQLEATGAGEVIRQSEPFDLKCLWGCVWQSIFKVESNKRDHEMDQQEQLSMSFTFGFLDVMSSRCCQYSNAAGTPSGRRRTTVTASFRWQQRWTRAIDPHSLRGKCRWPHTTATTTNFIHIGCQRFVRRSLVMITKKVNGNKGFVRENRE